MPPGALDGQRRERQDSPGEAGGQRRHGGISWQGYNQPIRHLSPPRKPPDWPKSSLGDDVRSCDQTVFQRVRVAWQCSDEVQETVKRGHHSSPIVRPYPIKPSPPSTLSNAVRRSPCRNDRPLSQLPRTRRVSGGPRAVFALRGSIATTSTIRRRYIPILRVYPMLSVGDSRSPPAPSMSLES